MSEPLTDQALDVNASLVALAALRQAGANQFDPVGLHYLEVLARRASARQGRVRQLLDDKLAQALAAFTERFARAPAAAKDDAKAPIDPTAPHAAQTASAQTVSLAVLSRVLTQRASGQAYDPTAAPEVQRFNGSAGLRPELNATQYFRATWSKFSVAKRVTQALDQAPKNAGPLNAHRLVLRSLAVMREISPDYLNRFTSYVDALLCLDQCDKEKQAQVKKTAAGDSNKKPKPRRTQAR
jgi:hypothetical protein